MAEISDLRAILRSRVTLPGQTATVAISHSIADRFFPMWLRSAYGTDIFPPIRIIAMDTNSSIESLFVGDCELVVLYTDSEHDRGFVPEDITFVTLREETIRLLAAPAFGSKLGAEPEQGMALISHGGGYFMGQTSDSIMSEMPNGRFRAVIECGLTSCVLTLALQGFGADRLNVGMMGRSIRRTEELLSPARWLAAGTLAVAGLIILVGPQIVIVLLAFNDSNFLSFPPSSYSIRWFNEYMHDGFWLGSTRLSFIVSVIAAMIATVLGTLGAFAVVRMRRKRLSVAVYMLGLTPMVLPPVLYAVGLFFVFIRCRRDGIRPHHRVCRSRHTLCRDHFSGHCARHGSSDGTRGQQHGCGCVDAGSDDNIAAHDPRGGRIFPAGVYPRLRRSGHGGVSWQRGHGDPTNAHV